MEPSIEIQRKQKEGTCRPTRRQKERGKLAKRGIREKNEKQRKKKNVPELEKKTRSVARRHQRRT